MPKINLFKIYIEIYREKVPGTLCILTWYTRWVNQYWSEWRVLFSVQAYVVTNSNIWQTKYLHISRTSKYSRCAYM
jgi:hypothetical protein